MTQIEKANDFVGYEYQEIKINKQNRNIYIDSYENFGWKFEREKAIPQSVGCISLEFKRDRKIRNKSELTRLQRQFDALIEQIDYLEKNKTLNATIIACIVGVIGCGFMAASVMNFVYLNNIVAMILFAIPGFLCWILPIFVYNRFKTQKTIELTPRIETLYDEVYEVTKRASNLL